MYNGCVESDFQQV